MKDLTGLNYRVALIQNESELLRYSNADIRSQFSEPDIMLFSYTASNIADISNSLLTYVAIFIATNALSDNSIRNELERNKEIFLDFCKDRNKGIFIGFQMWMAENPDWSIPFLPKELHFTLCKKITRTLQDGRILLDHHADSENLFCFPRNVNADDINRHCVSNSNTDGVYWAYISSFGEQFKSLARDEINPDRDLMAISLSPQTCRVIITTIVVDWQKHLDLFENITKFIIEGKTYVALVKKFKSENTDYQSIVSALEAQRIPFSEIDLSKVQENAKLCEQSFSTFVLDPRLGVRQQQRLVEQIGAQGFDQVFSFSKAGSSKAVNALTRVSGATEFERILQSGRMYLVAESRSGFWENSFWTTVDVVECLKRLGVNIEPYRQNILSELASHIPKNGSYDNVFGATCGLVKLLSLLDLKEHKYYSDAVKWILKKFASSDLFNRSTALDVFLFAGEGSLDEVKLGTLSEAADLSKCENRLLALRLCSLLTTSTNFTAAREQYSRLILPNDDENRSVHEKAEDLFLASKLLNSMIEIHPILISRCFHLARDIVDSRLQPYGDWGNCATTARCLIALHEYDKTTQLPIRSLLNEVANSGVKGLETENIGYLIGKNAELWANNQSLEEERKSTTKKVKAERVTFLIFYPLFSVLFFLFAFDFAGGQMQLIPFLKDWQDLFAPTIYFFILAFALFYLVWLRRWGFVPKFLEALLIKIGL